VTDVPLHDQVVVLTGASSGIGRSTAILLGTRGATVVLAARNEQALREVAQEVARRGGTPRVRVTDVAEWDDVRGLAAEAVEKFGRIDTWVSCAAVALYGTVQEVAAEEMARVVQVNLLGAAYGMKAALGVMGPQGSGAIVNVASALGLQAVPLQSAYVAAKHGVLGFADALRMELEHARSAITVSTVLPSSINTPLFRHARSHMGVQPGPIPPVYEPSVVAEAIVHVIEHPRPRTVVGGAGKTLELLQRLAPRLAGTLLLRAGKVFERQRTDRPPGEDNLFEASRGTGAVGGEFGDGAMRTSFYTTLLEQHPNRVRALLGTGAVACIVLLRRAGR
jgi:short-subunit dehydrogenase